MKEEKRRFIDVLDTFMDTCPHPTPHQVAAWTEAYPEYEEHFRRAAADVLAVDRITGGLRGRPPTEAETDAEFAKAVASAGLDAPVPNLAEIVDGSNHDLPTIASRLDIGVDVLVALEEGLCASAPPAGFIEALADVVVLPRRKVRGAIETSRRDAGLALAASMGTGTSGVGRTWDELLAASDMPQARKDFWRGDPPAARP